MRLAIVTMGVTALVAAGIAWGGPWAAGAVLFITVFAWLLDRIAALAAPDRAGQEFPAGTALSVALGLAHFPILFGLVAALAADNALIFVAASLFIGQIGKANAHELIHKARRAPRLLGVSVYASILFGHHASAHLRVHHVHGIKRRPEFGPPARGVLPLRTARLGGVVARRLAGREPAVSGARSAPLLDLRGRLGHVDGGGGTSGWRRRDRRAAGDRAIRAGAASAVGLPPALRPVAGGRLEPVGPQHSWNAPHGFSSAMMLTAPRHSDRHARPSRAYPGLELDRAAMPMLPHSLPVMAVIALLPPLWVRVMDKRARAWSPDAAAAPQDGPPVAAA